MWFVPRALLRQRKGGSVTPTEIRNDQEMVLKVLSSASGQVSAPPRASPAALCSISSCQAEAQPRALQSLHKEEAGAGGTKTQMLLG